MFKSTCLEQFKSRYPWPPEKPSIQPTDWSLDGGGKEIVIDKIRSAKLECIVEIGVFFGGSVRKWILGTSDTVVIAVDPWIPSGWWSEYAVVNGHEELAAQLRSENGPYETFLVSTWEVRKRVVPVKRSSPSVLYEIAEAGVVPDLFFFDSDKTGKDLEVAHELFPDAVLAGDDWTWGRDRNYPIRKVVIAFCEKHNYSYRTSAATWLIQSGPIPMRERILLAAYRIQRFPEFLVSRGKKFSAIFIRHLFHRKI